MNIQISKVKKEYEVDEKVVAYDIKDIKDMLTKDVNNKGFEVNQIIFKTTQKYITDEWGMNGRYATFFDGAKVIVK